MPVIPANDEEYLKQKGFDYEVIQVGPEIHIVLKNWLFPEAYLPRHADVVVKMHPGYPMSPMDMFWTSPDVRLVNGGFPTTADVHEHFNGKSWQRWSRHTSWRAGVDDLRSFIRSVAEEIKRGI